MQIDDYQNIIDQAQALLYKNAQFKEHDYSGIDDQGNTDRLANYYTQAKIFGVDVLSLVRGDIGKHLAWMVNMFKNTTAIISEEALWKHLGNIMCYMPIIIALVKERNNALLDINKATAYPAATADWLSRDPEEA